MIRDAAIVLALALSGLVIPACSSLSAADQIRARDEKLPVVITAANISVPNAIDGVTGLVGQHLDQDAEVRQVRGPAVQRGR
jgi:DNA-binding NtrC family response regulator